MCKYLIMSPCVLGRKKTKQLCYLRQVRWYWILPKIIKLTLFYSFVLNRSYLQQIKMKLNTTNNNELNSILLFCFKQKLFATNLDSINKLNYFPTDDWRRTNRACPSFERPMTTQTHRHNNNSNNNYKQDNNNSNSFRPQKGIHQSSNSFGVEP
jgi:hypothetical protein